MGNKVRKTKTSGPGGGMVKLSASGGDIVALAERHVGEPYVFGATVKYSNPNFAGPWDCAEFASWCAYQAYGLLYAVQPPNPQIGGSYSGYWYDDAIRLKNDVPVAQAIATKGAILVRHPRPNGTPKTGHVAISKGDGTTVEAMDTAHGVTHGATSRRLWDIGVFLPGVSYARARVGAYAAPSWMGPDLANETEDAALVQQALAGLGFDPGPVSGDYDDLTALAVAAFQSTQGLVVDGLVGPETLAALKLSSRVHLDKGDPLASLAKPRRVPKKRPSSAARAPVDFTFTVSKGLIYAAADGGSPFLIGKPVSYTDDMPRNGLYQPDGSLTALARCGVYDRHAEAVRVGDWAQFIWPTAIGESGGYFGRINSYDRAAFTWGCFQMAAHTPEANLVTLFRRLLVLPDAALYFPSLVLRPNSAGVPTVHRLDGGGGAVDLELARPVLRPNGKTEVQIPDFMAYLNPDPTAVGPEEKRAAAALMEWAAVSDATRQAQVDHVIDTMKGNLRRAAKALPELRNHGWPDWLWVSDIVFQGRAGYSAIRTALSATDPTDALSRLGSSAYDDRKATVRAKVAVLQSEGVMSAWRPPT